MHFADLYQQHPGTVIWLMVLLVLVPAVLLVLMNRWFGGPKLSAGRALTGLLLFVVLTVASADFLVGQYLYIQSDKTPELNVWNEQRVLMTLVFNTFIPGFVYALLVNKAVFRQNNVVYFKTSLVSLLILTLLGYLYTLIG